MCERERETECVCEREKEIERVTNQHTSTFQREQIAGVRSDLHPGECVAYCTTKQEQPEGYQFNYLITR